MYDYDQNIIKNNLKISDIFLLLSDFGGNPEYKKDKNIIVSDTICHNLPGLGSHKLYYYDNTKLFRCYTDCANAFDIFELYIKVKKIQEDKEIALPQAVYYIAKKFGFEKNISNDDEKNLEDWELFNNYDRIEEIKVDVIDVTLKQYNKNILNNFQKRIILPWLREGITQNVMDENNILYYAKDHQIVIPHFDIEGRLVGIRGRTLVKEDADLYGKYRPLQVGNEMYNHPLSFNLYGLNKTKDMIKKIQKVIIFESEKSVLLYSSLFGSENNISVATCGNRISNYQFNLLYSLGVKEFCFAFDKDFEKIGDDNFKRVKDNFIKINEKYSSYAEISFLFDKHNLLGYKCSPIDCGKEAFLELFKDRIIL